MNRRALTLSIVLLTITTGVAFAQTTPKRQQGNRQAKARKTTKQRGKPTTKSGAPAFSGAKTILYKTVGDVKLYLHVVRPDGFTSADRRPAIVFFFGGGWNGGSPKQFEHHCNYLAKRGMVAMAADYRVKSRNGTSPRECVQDGKSAIRFVRAHAKELGIDPQRIAAGGGSAGGHVAAATGILPGLDQPAEDTTVSAKPNALVLFNPVYDNGPEGYGYDRVKAYYKEISPLHNIAAGDPPTIVFLGTKDKLIPVATAKKFETLMKAAGNRCETHFYDGEGHGFFNYGRGDGHCYEDTVKKMDQFLVTLGFLETV